MPQKLQPRGISLAGLGHPGTGLFHSRQTQQQAKSRLEAGWARLDKRSLPGRERVDCLVGREKAGLGLAEAGRARAEAGAATHRASVPALAGDGRLTAVVLHYRQLWWCWCWWWPALVRGMVCDDTGRRRVDAMHANEARRGQARQWPPARATNPFDPRLVRCRLGSIDQCG